MRTSLFITALVGLIVSVSVAHASTVTFVTPAGSMTGGQPVDASAKFTTGPGSLSITLTNLEANPTSVVQALSDLSFTLSGGQTSGTLTSSSGQEITVNGNGSFTTGSSVGTGWVLTGLDLDVLAAGGAGPAHLVIGPPGPGGTYSNANGSIAGNGPHNPFLNQTAAFVLGITGLTATETVTSAIFSFGTTEGANLVTGVPSTVPLPGAFVLFGTVLVGGLGLTGWRKRRQRGPVSIMA
jgi:hypothetical protein